MEAVLFATLAVEALLWAGSRFAAILAQPSRRFVRAQLQKGL